MSLSAVFKDFPGLFAGIEAPQTPERRDPRIEGALLADEVYVLESRPTCHGCKETLAGELVCCDPDAAAFHVSQSDAE